MPRIGWPPCPPSWTRLKLHHLAGLHLLQPIDAGDTVADADDLPDLGHDGRGVKAGDLLLENICDFGGADFGMVVAMLCGLFEFKHESVQVRFQGAVVKPGAQA